LPVFEWKPSYSVNVKRCDDDHKMLFALICDLRNAIHRGKGTQVVDAVILELEKYSLRHFSGEEALMARTNYPGLEPHRIEHQKFIETLVRLRAEEIHQPIKILNFMNNWLVNHIKRTDQQYSAHLNAHGVS
jgi:hemerythrin-like metal-binding protein